MFTHRIFTQKWTHEWTNHEHFKSLLNREVIAKLRIHHFVSRLIRSSVNLQMHMGGKKDKINCSRTGLGILVRKCAIISMSRLKFILTRFNIAVINVVHFSFSRALVRSIAASRTKWEKCYVDWCVCVCGVFLSSYDWMFGTETCPRSNSDKAHSFKYVYWRHKSSSLHDFSRMKFIVFNYILKQKREKKE